MTNANPPLTCWATEQAPFAAADLGFTNVLLMSLFATLLPRSALPTPSRCFGYACALDVAVNNSAAAALDFNDTNAPSSCLSTEPAPVAAADLDSPSKSNHRHQCTVDSPGNSKQLSLLLLLFASPTRRCAVGFTGNGGCSCCGRDWW